MATHIPYRGSNAALYLLTPAGQWMHRMKLLGQRLMARSFDRKVVDVQVRSIVMTGDTAFGIPAIDGVGRIRPGKGTRG